MGAVQNSVNQTIRSIGVGVHAAKLSSKKSKEKDSKNISAANDGKKAKEMGEKARANKEALVQQKKQIQNKTKAVLSGANTDAKTRVQVMSDIRGGR